MFQLICAISTNCIGMRVCVYMETKHIGSLRFQYENECSTTVTIYAHKMQIHEISSLAV